MIILEIYFIGVILWFIITTLIKGYRLQEKNFIKDVIESLMWFSDVIYLLGVSVKLLKEAYAK